MSSRGTTLRNPLHAALSTGSLCIFDGAVGELQPYGVEAADKSDEPLRWITSIHLSRTLLFPRGSSGSLLGEVSADRDMEANNRGGGVRALVRAGVAGGAVGEGGAGGTGGAVLASKFSCIALPPRGVRLASGPLCAVSCSPRWPGVPRWQGAGADGSCCESWDVVALRGIGFGETQREGHRRRITYTVYLCIHTKRES
jgi:hypothetical protein